MIVAARTDHAGKGLWIFNGGSEYVLTNAALAIGLAFNGAGRWSVDNAIGWDVSGVAWGLGALGVAVAGAVVVLGAVRSPRPMAPAPSAAA
jgi:putative oxidoreductase